MEQRHIYREGEIVRVIENICAGEVPAGTVGPLTFVDNNCNDFVGVINGMAVFPDEIEPVTFDTDTLKFLTWWFESPKVVTIKLPVETWKITATVYCDGKTIYEAASKFLESIMDIASDECLALEVDKVDHLFNVISSHEVVMGLDTRFSNKLWKSSGEW